jgi:hypothetical protein
MGMGSREGMEDFKEMVGVFDVQKHISCTQKHVELYNEIMEWSALLNL